jgi:transposase
VGTSGAPLRALRDFEPSASTNSTPHGLHDARSSRRIASRNGESRGPNGPGGLRDCVLRDSAKRLFPKGLLHSSAIAHLLVQKFALGVPHYRLEQHMQAETVQIDRSTMCRYAEQAGGALGSTIVHAMWQDALEHAAIISTDANLGPDSARKGGED